jgi:hypothetical protein
VQPHPRQKRVDRDKKAELPVAEIMNKKIFLAFGGQPIQQRNRIAKIADGYECWNLKRFALAEYVATLKSRIAPVNNNALSNYSLEAESREIYGITDKQYAQCSWGLLIPDRVEDAIGSAYPETLSLINLYSPQFLYPIFYASDFGITRVPYDWPSSYHPLLPWQDQSKWFKNKAFVLFFRTLLPESGYGAWQLYRCQKWKDEDWRLFAAMRLYSGLQDYDRGKSPFTWQRESADMATILEALFTAGDSGTEEVGYRLRKRIAVLIGFRFPEIEAKVKQLYKLRSAFVHGSFFQQVAKQSRARDSNLPLPDFSILYEHRQYVRWSLVAYLNLALVMRTDCDFATADSVMSILEQAIIDVDLRRRLTLETRRMFRLMPKQLQN